MDHPYITSAWFRTFWPTHKRCYTVLNISKTDHFLDPPTQFFADVLYGWSLMDNNKDFNLDWEVPNQNRLQWDFVDLENKRRIHLLFLEIVNCRLYFQSEFLKNSDDIMVVNEQTFLQEFLLENQMASSKDFYRIKRNSFTRSTVLWNVFKGVF